MFSGTRNFTFGRNWRRFLKSYTPERQDTARKALLAFLMLDNLKGKTFLDIGCGSGINSAAAYQAGAKEVFSFDFDPDSVAATKQLHKHFGSPSNWRVEQASVLDKDFMQKLGTFDVVYAWGMLHHTGNLREALYLTSQRLHQFSRLYIALYAKEFHSPNWERWIDIKKRYNEANVLTKLFMEITYIWETVLGCSFLKALALPKIAKQYKHARGMTLMTDVRDWLGGWPTEFSSTDEVVPFAADKCGLSLINIRIGEPNTEYLFARTQDVCHMGLDVVDPNGDLYGIPVFKNALQIDDRPVWIFGTARGADIIFGVLQSSGANIAGFIDLEPRTLQLHGHRVVSLQTFLDEEDKESLVLLANRYVRENAEKLRDKGFLNLLNGHPFITSSHFNRV